MNAEKKIKKHILKRLLRRGLMGGRYARIEHILKGIPKHERNKKVFDNAVKELRQKGWIELPKKCNCITLTRNHKRLEEIKKYVDYDKFTKIFSLFYLMW